MTPNPPPDLPTIIRTAQAQARAEATREDGSVDALVEAVAFRRLVVEAAAQSDEEDASAPTDGRGAAGRAETS